MKLGPCLLLDEPSSSLVRFTFDEQGFSWEQAAENPEMRGGYGQFKEMPSGSRDWLVASTDTPNQVEYYHFDEKTQRLSHVFWDNKELRTGREEYADASTKYQWEDLTRYGIPDYDSPDLVNTSNKMIQNLLHKLFDLSSSEGPLSRIASEQLNRIVRLPWILDPLKALFLTHRKTGQPDDFYKKLVMPLLKHYPEVIYRLSTYDQYYIVKSVEKELDNHFTTGEAGQPDDFYRQLGASLLADYPGIFDELSLKHREALLVKYKSDEFQIYQSLKREKREKVTPDNLGKEYEDFPENVRKAAVRRYHFYQLLTKYNEYINNLLRFYLLRFSITDFFQPRKENSWGIDGLVQYIRQVLIDLNKILTQDLEKIELVVQKDIRFSWNRFYRDIPELEALLFKANAPHLQQALTDFKQTCKNDTATIELEFNEYRLPRDERLELQIYQDLKREKREKVTPDNLGKKYEDFPENVRKAAVRRYHFYQLLTKYNEEYIKRLPRHRKYLLGEWLQVSAEHWPLAKKLQDNIDKILARIEQISRYDYNTSCGQSFPVLWKLPDLWKKFDEDILTYEKSLETGKSIRYLGALNRFQAQDDIKKLAEDVPPRDERLELQIYQDLKREKREKVTPDNLGKKYEDFPENVRKAAVRRYHFYQLLTKYNEEHIKKLPRHRLLQPLQLPTTGEQLKHCHWPLAEKLQENINEILEKVEKEPARELPDLWNKFQKDILTYKTSLESAQSILYLDEFKTFQEKYKDDIRLAEEWFGDVSPRDADQLGAGAGAGAGAAGAAGAAEEDAGPPSPSVD